MAGPVFYKQNLFNIRPGVRGPTRRRDRDRAAPGNQKQFTLK
jgi:hypothetical protein